MMFFFL